MIFAFAKIAFSVQRSVFSTDGVAFGDDLNKRVAAQRLPQFNIQHSTFNINKKFSILHSPFSTPPRKGGLR